MKKLLAIILVAGLLSGCAFTRTELTGFIYTDLKGPITATGSTGSSTKVGTAKAQSVLGLVATGDASIEAAAKSAGITKIHHVDYESFGGLGIFATFTVIVYGE